MSVSLDQKPKHGQTQQNAQNNSLQINDNVAFPNEQQPGTQLPTAQATNNYYTQSAVSLMSTNLQQTPQQPQIQQLQQSQRPQPSTLDRQQQQQQSDVEQTDQQKEESLRHQFIQKNMTNINNKVINFFFNFNIKISLSQMKRFE